MAYLYVAFIGGKSDIDYAKSVEYFNVPIENRWIFSVWSSTNLYNFMHPMASNSNNTEQTRRRSLFGNLHEIEVEWIRNQSGRFWVKYIVHSTHIFSIRLLEKSKI